jgi:glycosyltransferase involved in cell wall biosynthesis
MRITLVTDPELVNSNYRAYQPMQVLSRQGHEIRYTERGQARFHPSLLSSDVIHVHRFWDVEMQRVAEQARAAGVGVVWDNDDDVTALPRWNPHYKQFGGPRRARVAADVQRVVCLADVVSTPSELLADQYREAGAGDVRVHENYLPIEFRSVARPRHDGIVIAWLAGLEHQTDYDRLHLRDTLLQLLDAHADLRVMSIGLGLGLPADRYEHHGLVDFLDLARTLARADIGIAPLADIPWNRARSNIKLKEYGAAGLAWLASPVGPYGGLGDKQGGRLVPEDGWFDALDDLIRDERVRRKLAKRATKWARGQTIDKHAQLWVSACEDAAARGRARRAAAA